MTVESTITLVAAVLALIASVVASAVSLHNARFRRFTSERWWERKATAYGDVVGSLVALTRSLERWVAVDVYEDAAAGEDGVSPKLEPPFRAQYKEAHLRIKRAATEGEYILSDITIRALTGLLQQLRQEPEWPLTTSSWQAQLLTDLGAAKLCLQTVRTEARVALEVADVGWIERLVAWRDRHLRKGRGGDA